MVSGSGVRYRSLQDWDGVATLALGTQTASGGRRTQTQLLLSANIGLPRREPVPRQSAWHNRTAENGEVQMTPAQSSGGAAVKPAARAMRMHPACYAAAAAAAQLPVRLQPRVM